MASFSRRTVVAQACRRGRPLLALALLALLLPAAPAIHVRAATFTVDSLQDGAASAANCAPGHLAGTCRLRDAIAAAASGDTITFSVTGTILLNATQGTLNLTQNVTIQGPGAGMIAIDGGCTYCDRGPTFNPTGGVRVFSVTGGVSGGPVAISGLTIQHGNASDYGGGITTHASSLTVTNTTFSGNYAGNDGGALDNGQGTLTVTNCTFTGNTALNYGGAIHNFASMDLRGSTLSGNAATIHGGGGIEADNSMTMENSTITGNTAQTDGGGIQNNAYIAVTASTITNNTASAGDGGGVQTNSFMTLANSIVSGNTGTYGGGVENNHSLTVKNSAITGNHTSTSESMAAGGGIVNFGNTLTILSSTVSGNTGIYGGGIGNYTGDSIALTNSTVSGNNASQQGGGIFNLGTLTAINSTIANNTATTAGGGIDNTGASPAGTLKPTNTLIAGNNAPTGPDVNGGTTTSGGHNLIGKTDGSSGWISSDKTGTIAMPLNPLLGPLADNGGTTPLPDGSHVRTLPLLAGSPAIDAGDDAVCALPLPPAAPPNGAGNVDERGYRRPQGPHCDIGAFELAMIFPQPMPPRPTGSVSSTMPAARPVAHATAPASGQIPLAQPSRH